MTDRAHSLDKTSRRKPGTPPLPDSSIRPLCETEDAFLLSVSALIGKAERFLDAKGIAMKCDYVWKASYQAAIFETDDVQKCLHAAKASIDARLHEMQLGNGGTCEERQAMSDALSKLNLIRKELERGPQRVSLAVSPQQRTG